MIKKIVAVIAVIWGAGILVSFLLNLNRAGGGAYGAGQMIGLAFGVLLLAAGLYALLAPKR
jgi:hypothetical protein